MKNLGIITVIENMKQRYHYYVTNDKCVLNTNIWQQTCEKQTKKKKGRFNDFKSCAINCLQSPKNI